MRKPHPHIPLTDLQHNTLIGLMLGDGHLTMGDSNINARLMVGRSIKDENYLRYEMDIFENFLSPRYQDKIPGYDTSIDKRTGKAKNECNFSTSAHPSFTPYYLSWYKDIDGKRTKIIPSNLQLNEQIIAQWIADDGSVGYNKLPYRFVVEISTHGFTQDEVNFLSKLLSDRYHEEFLVRPKNRKGKQYFIIKVYDSACRVMFADIDQSFKMTRKRLWDKPESRFYLDPPVRQRSMLKDFAVRKSLVKDIIDLGKNIKLLDLANKLGFVYNNKVEYKSVDRLLKPYLDNGLISKFYDNNDNNTCYLLIKK